MNKYLDLSGLSYFWDKIKLYISDKLDKVVTTDTDLTISGIKTFSNGLKLNTGSSWSNTDRTIPFSASGIPTQVRYINDNSSKGLTYNPSTGALKVGSIVKRGGTSSLFLMADGTTKDNSALRDDCVYGGDFITNSLSVNSGDTKKDLFINNINDRLYAANERFYVTHKVFNSSTNTFLRDLSTDIFRGNTEIHSNTITEGEYVELYIGVEPESTLGTNNKMLWTYGNERLYLTFYSGRYPDAIDEAKLYYKYGTPGWENCTITKISNSVYKILLANKTYPAAIKIKWQGNGTRLSSLSDVKAFAGRSTLNTESVATKYAIKQDFYGDIEAPKLIKRGGTSSQFLKADGSVDSNTYSKEIEIIDLT